MKRAERRDLQRRLPMLNMSEDLQHMMRGASDAERDMLGAMLLHYEGQLSSPAGRANPVGAAWGMHLAMDEAQRRMLATHPKAAEIQCRRGCSHCCHMHVTITLAEAHLALAEARTRGLQIDRERLARQAGRGLRGWEAMAPADQACVFLQADGGCGVYEHRPAGCRKLLVFTPAEQCDMFEHPHGQVGRLATPEAEVAYAVMITRGPTGSLPDMLLQAQAQDPEGQMRT